MERNNIYITFEEAQRLLLESVKLNKSVKVPVKESLGCILSENVYSPIDLPPFTNSAVDGYAINTDEISELPAKLEVLGEVRAGKSKRFSISKGGAIKVFTGSPIPDGADAVVEVERVETKDNYIILNEKPKKWKNIRFHGEEIKKGEKVLEAGVEITPQVAGFLSIMGIKYVKVYKKPDVFVIVTGSEIVEPGRKLKYGQVYDANSTSLYTALTKIGIKPKIERVKDNFKDVKNAFKRAYKSSDIIIFTGGISMGDYDMVKILVQGEGVKRIFYKVRQKPGKPLFFGKKGRKYIFGIPGNPAAVLTCFYEYVLPTIKKMMGYKDVLLKEEEKILSRDIKKKGDRLYFLRGRIEGDFVIPLPNQESHMLSSFAVADCLILAPQGVELIKQGEKVKIHRL